MLHREKERLRSQRRRVIAKIEDVLAVRGMNPENQFFCEAVDRIPTAHLDDLAEYAAESGKVSAEVVEVLTWLSTCAECEEVGKPSSIILLPGRYKTVIPYCLKCYAEIRHELV